MIINYKVLGVRYMNLVIIVKKLSIGDKEYPAICQAELSIVDRELFSEIRTMD